MSSAKAALAGALAAEASGVWSLLLGALRLAAAPAGSPRRPRVSLVATPIGPRIGGLQAYHTSVMLDNVEHSFSGLGVTTARGPESHRWCDRNSETVVISFGDARVDTANIASLLRHHFEAGSYDLLRKNCNSMSDVLLSYLLGRRLDEVYSRAERLGASADRFGLVQMGTATLYTPNKAADRFDNQRVVTCMREERHRLFVPPPAAVH